jgi:hypothetical protein
LLLGENTLVLLVLALGAAMLVGNGLAIVRPPEQPRKEGDLDKAPITRSVVMMVVGLVACIWALASLLVG